MSNTSYCSTRLSIIFTTCSKYCILPALAASCIGLGCAVLCCPALCLVALASLKSAHKGSGGFLCLAALGYPALLGWTWLRWLYPRMHIDQNRGSLGEAHRIKHCFVFLAGGHVCSYFNSKRYKRCQPRSFTTDGYCTTLAIPGRL